MDRSIDSQQIRHPSSDSELITYLSRELNGLKIEVQSSNALIRESLTLAKQSSKNIKTYFENQCFDGFLSAFDIALPVSTEVELRDLEMRCLDDEFRKSFVSFY